MKLSGKIAEEGFTAVGAKHFASGHHEVPRVWVMVADRHGARIFSKPEGHLEEIGAASANTHHSAEAHKAPREKDAQSFAHDIAAWLDQAVKADAFDRLVLAAAPHMLGDLRKVLGKTVQSRIVAEVDKDLTKMNEPDLRKELEKIV